MSILGNLYHKCNRDIEFRMDSVVGSDYTLIQIRDTHSTNNKDTKNINLDTSFPDEYIKIIVPNIMAENLALLLWGTTEFKTTVGNIDSECFSDFNNDKISSYEWISSYAYLAKDKEYMEKQKSEWNESRAKFIYRGLPKEVLFEIHDELLGSLKICEKRILECDNKDKE